MRNIGRLALWILILTVAVVLRDVTAGARHDQMAPAAPLELGDRGSDGGGGNAGNDDEDDDEGSDLPEVLLAEYFESDPLAAPDAVVAGDSLARLSWADDAPLYPGDRPGSLSALYDSSAPAGLFGFPLGQSLGQDDAFALAVVFVIDSEGFEADPNGFFQISWGAWNSSTTGLNRTGDFNDFASDTFELIEFDYFPNVSPFFGGPFLAPSLFGRPVGDPPDGFANFTSLFGLEVSLPKDVPLLAVLEHRPDDEVLVLQVYRVVGEQGLQPINGAVGFAPLEFLSLPLYEVDTLGLTLWNDGFGGPAPAVLATVEFHALVAIRGLPGRPEDFLNAQPTHE